MTRLYNTIYTEEQEGLNIASEDRTKVPFRIVMF